MQCVICVMSSTIDTIGNWHVILILHILLLVLCSLQCVVHVYCFSLMDLIGCVLLLTDGFDWLCIAFDL